MFNQILKIEYTIVYKAINNIYKTVNQYDNKNGNDLFKYYVFK